MIVLSVVQSQLGASIGYIVYTVYKNFKREQGLWSPVYLVSSVFYRLGRISLRMPSWKLEANDTVVNLMSVTSAGTRPVQDSGRPNRLEAP
jgi:hypothetical protein